MAAFVKRLVCFSPANLAFLKDLGATENKNRSQLVREALELLQAKYSIPNGKKSQPATVSPETSSTIYQKNSAYPPQKNDKKWVACGFCKGFGEWI